MLRVMCKSRAHSCLHSCIGKPEVNIRCCSSRVVCLLKIIIVLGIGCFIGTVGLPVKPRLDEQ